MQSFLEMRKVAGNITVQLMCLAFKAGALPPLETPFEPPLSAQHPPSGWHSFWRAVRLISKASLISVDANAAFASYRRAEPQVLPSVFSATLTHFQLMSLSGTGNRKGSQQKVETLTLMQIK